MTGKTFYHFSNDRAAAYTVPPPEPIGSVKYTAHHETIPNTCGVQMIAGIKLDERPVQCNCPNCHSLITTCVKRTPGVLVWIICFILILIGCWLGCCLIPFCIRGLQNTQHYCPNCKAFIGEYRPL